MTDRTPTTAALHEEHTCRDCGAVITLPYAMPPKHIGYAAPDPAPLDVLARAIDTEWVNGNIQTAAYDRLMAIADNEA